MTRAAPWIVVVGALVLVGAVSALAVDHARVVSRTVWIDDARAIDGDTLEAPDGEVIRLWGIDAPEAGSPGGTAATRALEALTRGRALRCERVDLDPYGRTVARCHLGAHDIDLACRMVATGHARDWPRYSGGAYADC